MKRYGLLIMVFIVAAIYSTPAQQFQGCGPAPNVPTVSQTQSQTQAQQIAKQIQIIQAQANHRDSMAKIQTQMQISQLQNSGNPQMQAQAMQGFQQQIQQLQQSFTQTMQNLQRQP